MGMAVGAVGIVGTKVLVPSPGGGLVAMAGGGMMGVKGGGVLVRVRGVFVGRGEVVEETAVGDDWQPINRHTARKIHPSLSKLKTFTAYADTASGCGASRTPSPISFPDLPLLPK